MLCLPHYFLIPSHSLFPAQGQSVSEAPQPIICLTFLIPVPRVMLGLRVLGVKGLVWLRQMRNPIDEVLDSIQDIIGTQLQRTHTPGTLLNGNRAVEGAPTEELSVSGELDLKGRSVHAQS